MIKKMTPEDIAEMICRLDGPQLAQLGDILEEKGIANTVSFVCEVAVQDKERKDELQTVQKYYERYDFREG